MAEHDHGHDHDQTVDCQQVLAELYTFLDGELTIERRSRIQVHLDDCNPCLEVFDFEAELRQVIRSRCTEEVPDSLRQRVEQQLQSLDLGPEAEATP
jgi:mycothiol system anti-sigma-R factor